MWKHHAGKNTRNLIEMCAKNMITVINNRTHTHVCFYVDFSHSPPTLLLYDITESQTDAPISHISACLNRQLLWKRKKVVSFILT